MLHEGGHSLLRLWVMGDAAMTRTAEPDEIDNMCAAAAQLPNFELFYVAVNKIGDAGVSAIAEQLKSTKVWQLVLTETNCGDKGAAALAVAGSNPEHFASLRWLFLDSTEVGDKGVDALSQAFVTGFQSLERLALQNTKLTNKGLTMLADAISKGGALHARPTALSPAATMPAEERTTRRPRAVAPADRPSREPSYVPPPPHGARLGPCGFVATLISQS